MRMRAGSLQPAVLSCFLSFESSAPSLLLLSSYPLLTSTLADDELSSHSTASLSCLDASRSASPIPVGDCAAAPPSSKEPACSGWSWSSRSCRGRSGSFRKLQLPLRQQVVSWHCRSPCSWIQLPVPPRLHRWAVVGASAESTYNAHTHRSEKHAGARTCACERIQVQAAETHSYLQTRFENHDESPRRIA